MSPNDPSTTPEQRQRRTDFDVLAPLTIVGVLLSVVAVAIVLLSANSGGETAAAAPATDVHAGMEMGDGSAAAPAPAKLTADYTMPAFDPVTKPVAAGPKTFDLVATERNVKVGAKVYTMWMFNKTVPGPVMRAVVGDTITVNITNASDSKMPHSVDFHASRLTLGGGHVQVAPGTTGTFTFTADYPGVFMYHCATTPVLHHIGMGMYGMLIVQPADGFGPPMPEYALTQSELYASPTAISENQPDAMAFNGIPNQYGDHPIKVPADSHARVFVLNAGPSEQSSFHVVGTIFDRALADGNPRNATFGRQAIGIPTSGSTVVEMQFVGEGQFPFVTHQFNLAAKGAVGMFLAGDGKPGPGAIPAAKAGENGHH